MAKLSFADTYKLALSKGLNSTDAYKSATNWQNMGGKDAPSTGSTGSTGSSGTGSSGSTNTAKKVANAVNTNNTSSGSTYTAPKTGESDYSRTARALNEYASSGNQTAYNNAVKYAVQQGWGSMVPKTSPFASTTDKTAATAGTATSKAVTPTIPEIQSGVASSTGNNNYPYNGLQTDILSAYPKYTPKTADELLTEAQNYANLQIDPQKTALQTALADAIASANNYKTSIEADYATLGDQANDALSEAQKNALISANARGMGRSGAVDYERGVLQKPILKAVASAETQKAANLANVDNSLATSKKNYDTAVTNLETQRGTLTAQQLATAKALDYAMQTGNWSAVADYASDIANKSINEKANDTTAQSNDIANIGYVPPAVDTSYSIPSSSVSLRDYTAKNGGTINYNATTQDVTVNGKTYSKQALSDSGAKLVNGSWYIPESLISQML